MRAKISSHSIFLALAGILIVSTLPGSASASKGEPEIRKLGIGESFGRWPGGVVHWVYNSTDEHAVFSNNAYFVGLLQDAMAEIEGVSGLTFVYDGVDNNVVLNNFSDNVVAVGWAALGGAAGQAGPNSSCTNQDVIDIGYCEYVDGVVRFNFGTNWDTGVTEFTEREFRQVAVHELLHLVGIGHSDEPVSIMYADPYTNLSTLRQDDIDALQSLYGEPDEMSQEPIYLPPVAAQSSPLMDAFISSSVSIGVPISEINGTEATNAFAGLSWRAQGPYTDDVTIVATDPHGFYYQGKLDDRDCGAGICTFWSSFATMEAIFTFPGVWTVYVIVDEELVSTETVTVTTSPVFNEAPDSTFFADAVYGPAPLTVTMKLSVTGDNEGDAVNASWHIPTVGEIELDSGNFPGSAGDSTRTVTFDTPGTYEIYTVVNDDWDRYGNPGAGDEAGPGFRTLYRTVVRVTKVSDDITALPDVTADMTPDLATHVGSYTSRPKIVVISGADGSEHAKISYLTDQWRGIAISTVRDADQNGTANDPAVAMLADRKTFNKIAVEVRRVDDGSKIKKIDFLTSNWRAIDVVVVDDTDGDGNTDDTTIGVLAQHRTNGKIAVELRNLDDGSKNKKITYLSSSWHAVAAAVADRSALGKGPLLAVLAENPSSGKRRIESRRVLGKAVDRKIDTLSSNWSLKDLTVIHDFNGNGVNTDPAWQILAIRNTDKQIRVKTIKVSNGEAKPNRSILTSNWEGLRLDSAADMNANGSQEMLVALINRGTGKRRIHVKDHGTNTLIFNIKP